MTSHLLASYDFIVTGASGSVGRRIIPLLAREKKTVLVVGRDVRVLERTFSNYAGAVSVADYDQLAKISHCHTLIHLAVRNNDRPGPLSEFTAANVEFAERIAREFIRMQGRRFLNISSILALNEKDASPYARSKAIAHERLADILGPCLDTVYIGYFHDRGYFGEKMRILRFFGPKVGATLFSAVKILKPSTSAAALAGYVMSPPGLSHSPSILTDDIAASRIYRLATRLFDLAVALSILVLLSPLMVILAIAIRFDSPGPALFRQERVGMCKMPFTLYKFRTMKSGTVAAATHEVSAAAVTKIGKYLRGTKLDELPQAFNLLRGEMTLVGPRPCLFSQRRLIEARDALAVYALKPGITGYAQVREIDMSQPDELATNDYIYGKLQSLLLNLDIVIKTAVGRGTGDRVVADDHK